MEATSLVERGRERVGHVNKVSYVRRVIAKKKKQLYRRLRRPELSVSKTLQQLFDSCREAFKGPGTVPSPQDVQRLRHILSMILLILFIFFIISMIYTTDTNIWWGWIRKFVVSFDSIKGDIRRLIQWLVGWERVKGGKEFGSKTFITKLTNKYFSIKKFDLKNL